MLMRTRNPCALRRRLVFGWNVRLPFMESLRRRLQQFDSTRSNRTVNVSERFQRVSMCVEPVLKFPSFSVLIPGPHKMVRSVSSQSFPHLWKKLWKSARSFGLLGLRLDFLGVLVEAKVREHDKLPLPLNGSS